MSSASSQTQPHIHRTASSPRDPALHPVTLSRVTNINPRTREIRLDITPPSTGVQHVPGQWLDVHIHGLASPGGFTITSPPRAASSPESALSPHLLLTIQLTPNPAAAFFFRPEREILSTRLDVRVGGSFTFPPPSSPDGPVDVDTETDVVVFVAGGIGINPFTSMLRHFEAEGCWPRRLRLLYSLRGGEGEQGLMVRELLDLVGVSGGRLGVGLFFTGGMVGGISFGGEGMKVETSRRMECSDVSDAVLGGDVAVESEKGREEVMGRAVFYVCGPQGMTDEFVDGIRALRGVKRERVLCEKWW